MHTLDLRSFLWFITGVALTITSVATFGAWRADAAVTPGESTFVPITPCRLFDTRPGADNVGPRSAPIGQTDVVVQVTGTNGDCTIPSDATAVAMNVTAVNPTQRSFLQAFPSDVTRPARGSNLNFVAGQTPVPNKVDVKLGATGAIKFYNHNGTVDALADVVGYYTSSTISQLSADVASLQSQIGALNEDVVSLLEDTNVIPSGVTVTGYDGFDGTTTLDNQFIDTQAHLPGRTPVALTAADINVAASSPLASDGDASCTGTSSAPTAPAGQVCIYPVFVAGLDELFGSQAIVQSDRSFFLSGTTNLPGGGGSTFITFAWAYTAP